MEGISSVLEKYNLDKNEEGGVFSKDYLVFREEVLGRGLTFYEKACKFCVRYFPVKLDEESEKKVEKAIEFSHLLINPREAASFGLGFAVMVILIGIFLFVLRFGFYGLLGGNLPGISFYFLIFLIMGLGVFMIKPMGKYPLRIANKFRMEVSDRMVLCVLYVVMYMRHTSNFERAIKFAGDHVGGSLALDLRKIYWDVEIGKYSTIKESVDNYLEQWKDKNIEFVESMQLIAGSLYEGTEKKRIEVLEKGLNVMLEGSYEGMMHYAQNLKNPVTNLHMLGVVLPILGLIILPLLGSFLGVKWYVLGFFYDVALPAIVYFYGTNLLNNRPTGFGGKVKYLENPRVISESKTIGIFIGLFLVFIGFLPLVIHLVVPDFDIPLRIGGSDVGSFLDFRSGEGGEFGPFGIGAVLFSLLIPLGLAFGYGAYCKRRSSALVKTFEDIQKLEVEFSGSLFQLGNRVGDGLPVEVSFRKVAESLRGTASGEFFALVSNNLEMVGMSLQEAIFNPERGAIRYFNSPLIESSMKVMLEASRKGGSIVAQSLISISNYFRQVHLVVERLKDLLADVISSMKGQISFLTPVIGGVVVGIGTMITTIIGLLAKQFTAILGAQEAGGVFNVSTLLGLFPIEKVIPPFYFQLIVGIYVVEVTIILSLLSNGIENGVDKISQLFVTGKNLYRAVLTYFIIAGVVTLIFNLLASTIARVNIGV